MELFGRRLRAARIVAGFDCPTDFASALGIEAPRYDDLEGGRTNPTLTELRMIGMVTMRSIDFLVTGRVLDHDPRGSGGSYRTS